MVEEGTEVPQIDSQRKIIHKGELAAALPATTAATLCCWVLKQHGIHLHRNHLYLF